LKEPQQEDKGRPGRKWEKRKISGNQGVDKSLARPRKPIRVRTKEGSRKNLRKGKGMQEITGGPAKGDEEKRPQCNESKTKPRSTKNLRS